MKLNLPKPHISPSQLSKWKYNKGQYVDSYILGIPSKQSPELLYGKRVSEWLENGTWEDAPEDTKAVLAKIKRHSNPEHEIRETFNTEKGAFEFFGIIDSFNPTLPLEIREYKTSRTVWNQKRADEHLQTQLYAAIIHGKTKRFPRVYIDWIETHIENGIVVPTGKIKTFKVKVTGDSMMEAVKEMKETAMAIHDWYTEYQQTLKDVQSEFPPTPDWMK